MENQDSVAAIDAEIAAFEAKNDRYASMAGYDPFYENRERLLKDIKKNPRKYRDKPDMIFVDYANSIFRESDYRAAVELFGPFWYEEELAVLFAPTGVGKSVLAMQIAESLSRGIPLAPFDKSEGPRFEPKRVFYLDFELSYTQFLQRYSTPRAGDNVCENKYVFASSLLRGSSAWNCLVKPGYKDLTEMIFTDLEKQIVDHEPEVLIVDNITFLTSKSTSTAGVAIRIMRHLLDFKSFKFLSILAIAHTPKRRYEGPLTASDMQGSADIAKIADSVFALGRSQSDPDLRYLKQIKSRSSLLTHDEANVPLFRLEKQDFAAIMQPDVPSAGHKNFLGFTFTGFGREEDHVELANQHIRRRNGRTIDAKKVKKAKDLSAKGLSVSAVAKELEIPKTTAHRLLHF